MSQPRSIAIMLPMPATCLWPNRMGHWAKRSKAKKSQRSAACALALPHRPRSRQPIASGIIEFAFHWPDKRRRDMDNALAAMKSAIDGLKDAGIIEDDSGFAFHVERMKPDPDVDAGVWVTVQESAREGGAQ